MSKGCPLGIVKACLFSDRFGHVGLCRNQMVLARICVIKPVAFESGTLRSQQPMGIDPLRSSTGRSGYLFDLAEDLLGGAR